MLSVAGRSVIVTGGSRGIGKGIARVFANAGCKVLVLSRNGADAEAVAKEIGDNASGLAADVSNFDDMVKAVNTAVERHGGLDIVCANAGILPQARIESMTDKEWDEMININLKGSFYAVKAAIPELKKSNQGRIIFTSSITGPTTGYPGWAHYAATKAGQLGFMRTACLELAPHGITVNAVLPGNILTEGLISQGESYIKSMTTAIPLKKLGTVEDIGNAALFLASKEAGFITGQTIVVDGGQTIPECPDAIL